MKVYAVQANPDGSAFFGDDGSCGPQRTVRGGQSMLSRRASAGSDVLKCGGVSDVADRKPQTAGRPKAGEAVLDGAGR